MINPQRRFGIWNESSCAERAGVAAREFDPIAAPPSRGVVRGAA
jgi:hypothetical protein